MYIRLEYFLILSILLNKQFIFSLIPHQPKLINSFHPKSTPYKKTTSLFTEITSKNSINLDSEKMSDKQKKTSISILENGLFAIEVKIGSNEQAFNLILDTGSFYSWIPENTTENVNVRNYHLFNPENSSTAHKTNETFILFYGNAYVFGYFYSDQFKILPQKNVSMLFGVANNTNFDINGADGIMGLARKYNKGIDSSILKLKQNNMISSNIFSIKYYDENQTADLFLGEEHNDFDLKENIGSCLLQSNLDYNKYFWTCKLKTFSLNYNNLNYTFNLNKDVLFNTGINWIILPKNLSDSLIPFLEKFNCFSYDESRINSKILCRNFSQIPNITLEIGQYYFFMNNSYMYNEFVSSCGTTFYELKIYFEENIEFATIGMPFFYQFHTMFDMDSNILKFYSKEMNIKKSSNTLDDSNEYYNNINIFLRCTAIILVTIFAILLFILFLFIHKKRKIKQMSELDDLKSFNKNISLLI